MSAHTPTGSTTRERARVSEWLAAHDVIPALVPFAYRNGDPVAQLLQVRRGLDALPHTAATFTSSEIFADGEAWANGFEASQHLTDLYRLCGSFRVGRTSTGWRWANPEYVHGTPVRSPQGNRDERVDFARDVAALGTVDSQTVADKFGISRGTLTYDFEQADFAWDDRRTMGKRRFARTLYLIADWTDHDMQTVAEATAASENAAAKWRKHYVADDWTPPEDPTTEHGIRDGADW